MNFAPPLESETEEQVSAVMSEAARIVNGMKTPQSKITALIERLKQNMSAMEKDEVREELKQEIASALKDAGIPTRMINKMIMVFANMLTEGVEVVHVERGE